MAKPINSEAAGCCMAVYDHPAVRYLTGGVLHPGGAGLTRRISDLAGITSSHRVVDLGSGDGFTAVTLAGSVGCSVHGVTIESTGVQIARERAEELGVSDHCRFVKADFMVDPITEYGPFDAAILECVLSTVTDKLAALERILKLLAPGGVLAISDVLVNGRLPESLAGPFGSAVCVGGALSSAGYIDAIERAGYVDIRFEDHSDAALAYVDGIGRRLMLAEAAFVLGNLETDRSWLEVLKPTVAEARRAVVSDALGYGLFVARKPR